MGKRQKEVIRVVLDTNVVISALLFTGRLSRIVELWREGKITPIISKETFHELRRVLEYPKFTLSTAEIRSIIEHEVLPFFEVVEVSTGVKGACRDPEDDKFLSCAVAGNAACIVSGDKDLLNLKEYRSVKVISASDFMKMFE